MCPQRVLAAWSMNLNGGSNLPSPPAGEAALRCLHTLPTPALLPCLPAQDCEPGQGLVSLGYLTD